MLQSFVTSAAFRALTMAPFVYGSETCVLGRRTIVYGRNGSGKTTFSELLRLVSIGGDSEGATATASIRKDDSTSSIRLDDPSFPWKLFIYNRYYVQDSLGLFLDGSGGSPTILKLGSTNVAAAQDLQRVRSSLSAIGRRREAIDALMKLLIKERESTEKEVKSEIIAALSPSDPAHYNQTRFQVTRAKALLQEISARQLDPGALRKEVQVANSPVLKPAEVPAPWPTLAAALKETINDQLLSIRVESQPIPRLASGTSTLADWIETGIGLHEAGDLCSFCQQGTVTTETLAAYAQHFSEALDALRSRLRKAASYLAEGRSAIEEWLAGVPAGELLLVSHREPIHAEAVKIQQVAAQLQAQIEQAITRIEERLADPLKPIAPEKLLAADFVEPDTTTLAQLIQENNEACERQSERKKEAQAAVEMHFGAMHGVAYRHCQLRIGRADRATSTLGRRQARLQIRAADLEHAQDDTGRMAVAIDRDLREHFGHGHLRVSMSGDGKGYIVQRGSKPAKRLSEGERNAIAFSFFLRSLEGEGVDPTKTIVVIDDPVTSMDKESLFAAFALAEERTKDFAQVVVLTHDYEYFRLQLGQRANARKESEKRIRQNDSNERAFPAVSILEMSATIDPERGNRVSALRKLPASLLRHPSEYHYLFLKVADAILAHEHETLPLLGNAARRLLEGFIAFRAPSGSNFQEKVDLITRAGSLDAVLSRRVVKFLHGQSHRDEPRITSALDFPSVEAELRAALDFIRRADSSHFVEMCAAVEIDAEELQAAVTSSTEENVA